MVWKAGPVYSRSNISIEHCKQQNAETVQSFDFSVSIICESNQEIENFSSVYACSTCPKKHKTKFRNVKKTKKEQAGEGAYA